MNREEIIAGLNAGKRLHVDRRDCPHLPWLMEKAEADRALVMEAREVLEEARPSSEVASASWEYLESKVRAVEELYGC